MTNNYLLNSIDSAVNDHLTGIVLLDHSVTLIKNVNAIVRNDFEEMSRRGQVFVISGGGAGHEPMFAGFVGKGQLSAAISGEFFASPSVGQIVKTIETICKKHDQILFLVANYTGDRLNFGLAKESLGQKGFKNIELFCFGDDISQILCFEKFDDHTMKRQRGLAGIDFMIKIAGQASEEQKSLSNILEIVKNQSARICTISVSLTACEIPGVGFSFSLDSDQMELGLGIHGEPGIERTKVMSAKETVTLMFDNILKYYRMNHSECNELNILINNLGSMTQLELNIIAKEFIQLISSKKEIILKSIQVRSVMTSFNMKGFSISAYSGSQIKNLPDYTVNSHDSILSAESQPDEYSNEIVLLNRIVDQSVLIKVIKAAAIALINNHEQLNVCDSAGGDSDCGTTMARIGEVILKKIQSSETVSFASLAHAISDKIGGTSGAIYGLLLFFIADFIVHHSSKFVGIKFWCELLKFSTKKLSDYSGAQRQDRTMIDALWALESELEKLSNMREEFSYHQHLYQLKHHMISANEQIGKLSPKAGRSANVDHNKVKSQYDPGSFAVVLWCNAIIDTLLCNEQ